MSCGITWSRCCRSASAGSGIRAASRCRQPQRRHPASASARRDPTGPWPGRQAPPQAGLAVRRPRLRPRHLPRPGPCPRHRARDRPPWHPARHRTGHLPLGGRAKFCVAARLPTSAHPMGTANRHPRSVPQTRLLPHHPPTTRLTVLAVVKRSAVNVRLPAAVPIVADGRRWSGDLRRCGVSRFPVKSGGVSAAGSGWVLLNASLTLPSTVRGARSESQARSSPRVVE